MENKERQTTAKKNIRKKKKRKGEKNYDFPPEKKVALESPSSVTDVYDARLYELKEKF